MTSPNPYQPSDPAGAPPAVTPADSASNPAGFAAVTPHGRGPAPYDIQAPMDDLAAVTAAAEALTGAGVLYPRSERQIMAQHVMDSPAGFDAGGGLTGWDIQEGFSGSGAEDYGWPNNAQPLDQPGYVYPGAYPGTVQPGIGIDDRTAN